MQARCATLAISAIVTEPCGARHDAVGAAHLGDIALQQMRADAAELVAQHAAGARYAPPDITVLRDANVPNPKEVLGVAMTHWRFVPKMGACHLLRMRIIARRTLRQFVESRAGHRDQQTLKAALDAWFDEVRKAKWSNTAGVKRLYASASIVSGDRLVFKIKRQRV